MGWVGDIDYFKVVLEASTDLWVYTTGGVDTKGWLRDGSDQTITQNEYEEPGIGLDFALRRTVDAGTYYIRVASSERNSRPTGDYTLHVREVIDPGNSISAATQIEIGGRYGGRVNSAADEDYFQFTASGNQWVQLRAIAIQGVALALLPAAFDSENQEISMYASLQADWAETSKHGVSFDGHVFLEPGTYYFKVKEESTGLGGRYTLKVTTSSQNQAVQDRCTRFVSLLGEPLSGCQWHLKNTGAVHSGGADQDLNVEPAWEITKGRGVTVAVIGTGFRVDHPDLIGGVLTELNHTATGSFYHRRTDESTSEAAVIAARDNDFGMVGIAPEALIYGSNAVMAFTASNISHKAATAALLHLDRTAVSSNAWGPADDGSPKLAASVWEEAIERGISEGFGGKGVAYVFSAGGGGNDDYSNLSEFASHHGTITVCAVDYKDVRNGVSERGPNLWVCAFSDQIATRWPGIGTAGIATAVNAGYTDSYGRDIAAVPQVAGVAALMRAANSNLTWRDVKLILAATARKNHSSDPGWGTAGLKFGSTTERYNYNHSYGFGVADAGAAVTLAQTWTSLPGYRTLTVSATDLDRDLDDNTVTETFEVSGDHIKFVEYVTVNLDIDHTKFIELTVRLTSPSGTTSTMLVGKYGDLWQVNTLDLSLDDPINVGTARHLGEDPTGTWKLEVTDGDWGGHQSGTLNGWSLTVHGHGHKPLAPTISSVDSGNTYLDLKWVEPEDIGASAVSGYDLRYIRSDATNKADEEWTQITGIWSAGDFIYELGNLTINVGYDVTVRATNDAGSGPWAEVATGQTMLVAPKAPTIDSVTAGNQTFQVSWGAPARTGGAAISRYDVRYIRSDASDKADTHWAVETAWNTGDSALEHTASSIDDGLEYDIGMRAVNSFGPGAWSDSFLLKRNQAPRFSEDAADTLSVDENTPANRAVGQPVVAIDEEGDTLTYSIKEGASLFSIDSGTGQLLTKDALNHEFAHRHTVTVQVSDGKSPASTASNVIDATHAVTVTVNNVNEPPVAADDRIDIREDQSVEIDVLGNDRDPDAGDSITLRIVRSPGGTASVGPNDFIAYTPQPDRAGADSFVYELRDSGGESDRATVEINVLPENDRPTFGAATAFRSVASDAEKGVRVGAPVTATDVDGDTLMYSLYGASEFEIDSLSGQITVAENAVFDSGVRTSYDLTIEADDGYGGTASIAVTISATPGASAPNQAEEIVAGSGSGGRGGGGGGGGGGRRPPEPALPVIDYSLEVVDNQFVIAPGNPDLAHNIPHLEATFEDGTVREADFLGHYLRTGDLTRWGYPTSEVLALEDGALTQFYQRGVVDFHDVGFGWIVERRLAWDYVGGGVGDAPDQGVEPGLFNPHPGRPLGPWGHKVSDFAVDGTQVGFARFFERLGGVGAIGLPKTDARVDNGYEGMLLEPGKTLGFVRQYFQAAVFEYHPNDPRAPVKLSLLGDTLRGILVPEFREHTPFKRADALNKGKAYEPYAVPLATEA